MTDSHDTEPLKAGDHFGDYVVERKLGSGAMGAVYLVRAPDDSLFAVKIMFPGKMTHDLRSRFAHEADFAMKIRHRNLISVYDVGEDPETGLCYIIMDYVPGGTLSDRIKAQGRIPVDEAVKITMQIAAGLDVAHKNGLVHRDVKPDNIMFDADGTPKLADLGVAKFDDDRKTMVTMTGMVIGTPAYMSPEQLMDSHRIDARADIYSLGVVLYEMLAGTRPNSNSTAVELLAKAIKGEKLPDIRKICPEISAAVAHVLSLMCAPKPDERPATSIEAAKLLHKAVTGKLVLPKKAPKSTDAIAAGRNAKRKRVASVTLVIAGLLTLLFAGTVGIAYTALRNAEKPMPSKSAVAETDRRNASSVVTNVVEKIAVVTNIVEKIAVVTNIVEKDIAVTHVGGQLVSSAGGLSTRKNDTLDESGDKNNAIYANGPRSATTSEALSSKIGAYTWYYSLEGDNAVIRRGSGGYNSMAMAAVSPPPVGRVVVPESIDGHKVTVIGNHAFFECEKMTEIVLPDGLKEIRGWGAFYRCIGLKKLVVPSSLEKFCGLSAVLFCINLEELDLQNCRFFEGSSVNGCPKCRFKVADSNPFYATREGALYSKDMKRLVRWPESNPSLDIPDSVVEIGKWGCHRCPARDIIFRGSVVKIGEAAFSDMNSITNVVLPEGVSHIGPGAFRSCKELKTITFPSSVKRINGSLFQKCMKLREVKMLGSAPSELSRSFLSKTDENLTVFVPKGSVGWIGRGIAGLPERWPVGGGVDARRIAYSGPTVTDKNELPAQPYISKSKLHARLDAKKLYDKDSTRAVQKALDALFPGWKTTENESRIARPNGAKPVGFVQEYQGHTNLVCTLPTPEKPVVLYRKLLIPAQNPCLKLACRKNASKGADFRLQVCVDKKIIHDEIVNDGIWRDLSLPLNAWAGKNVKIEVRQSMLKDNPWGRAYWFNLEVTRGEGGTRLPPVDKEGTQAKEAKADRTDDEGGWEKAPQGGVTVFRTNRPKELVKYLKK